MVWRQLALGQCKTRPPIYSKPKTKFRSIRDVEICVLPYVRETSDGSVLSSHLLPLQKKRVQADREASPPGLIRGHPCRECWLSRQDKAAGPTRSSRSVPPTRSFPASLWHMSSRSDAGKWARYVDSPFWQADLASRFSPLKCLQPQSAGRS